MSLSDLIRSSLQRPTYSVQYRGYSFKAQTIRIERAYDQQVATCTITTNVTPSHFITDDIHQIKVYIGFESYANTVMAFTGYVDDVKFTRFPDTWDIVCRDVLGRAQDTWLDDLGRENAGAAPAEFLSTQAETAVSNLLARAGLTVVADTTNFTIGDVNPAKFHLTSVFDAAKQIADLIGWRLWADVDGTVYFKYQRPVPSTNITWSYTKNKIKQYDMTTTFRNLRNRILAIGYDRIRAAVNADSPYVNNPPRYRMAAVSSELIDTQPMAETMALWMLNELNRIQYVLNATVTLNPLIDVGRTIFFSDDQRNMFGIGGYPASMNMYVFSVRHTLDGLRGEAVTEFTAFANESGTSDPNWEPNPPEPPPVDPPPDPPPPAWTDIWYSNIYVLLYTAGVFYTSDFSGPGGVMPTWTNVGSIGTNGFSASLQFFAALKPDPFTPSTRQYVMAFRDSGLPYSFELYRCENSGTWEKVLDNTIAVAACGHPEGHLWVSMGSYAFDCDINTDGYIALVGALHDTTGSYADDFYYLWSTDYGATWNATAMGFHATLPTNFNVNNFWIGAFGGGDVIYASTYSGGGGSGGGLAVSEDKGATWAYATLTGLGGLELELTTVMTDPHQDVVYLWSNDSGGLWRSTDRGANVTNLLPSPDGSNNFTQGGVYDEISPLYPGDGLKATTLRALMAGSNPVVNYKTTDAGDTWTPTTLAQRAGGVSIVHGAPDKLYLINIFSSTHVWVSEDEGVTMEDKSGTDTSPTTTTGLPSNGGSLVGILQVWDGG